MNLRNLTDIALLNGAERFARAEREALTNLLHHLREIERRRLYSALKYSSLFEYAVAELKYSEDQARRRINAMKLMRDVPEIEHKIAEGKLSLSKYEPSPSAFLKREEIRQRLQPRAKSRSSNKA